MRLPTKAERRTVIVSIPVVAGAFLMLLLDLMTGLIAAARKLLFDALIGMVDWAQR